MSANLKNKRSGFTLTELMVTLGIVAIISTVVLSGQTGYMDSIAISNLAEDVSLSVSEAQTYSIGVREVTPGSGEFSASFGLAFSLRASPNGDPYSYIYFADRDSSKVYNGASWTCTVGGASECLSRPQITRGNFIYDICALTGASLTEDCSPGRVDITFTRPSTEATFRFFAMNGSVYTPSNLRGVRIKLRSPRATERSVSVFITGQVSVQ